MGQPQLVLQVLWAAGFNVWIPSGSVPVQSPLQSVIYQLVVVFYYLDLQGTSKSVKFCCCHKGVIFDTVKKNRSHVWWYWGTVKINSVSNCTLPEEVKKCMCHGADNSDPAFFKTIHFVLRLKPTVSQLQELTLLCHLGANTLGWILFASIR